MASWINQNINTSAIDEVVYSLFPSGVIVNKISYMPQTHKVKILAEGELKEGKELSSRFEEITGLTLIINEEDEKEPDIVAADNKNQMEQNEALRYIDGSFSSQPHKPHKKSIKVTKDGVKYIELSFISKAIGEQYGELIKKLKNKTGYTIIVGDSCNQIEVINTAKRLMNENRIVLKKNPSVFLDKMTVQVLPDVEVNAQIKEQVKNQFIEMTGLALDFKK